ncbi:MAG: CAP domain-containing protein [Planctomycetes bacterium]|nr:CAP domain-containing protein [Planctomycetota bacterium]
MAVKAIWVRVAAVALAIALGVLVSTSVKAGNDDDDAYIKAMQDKRKREKAIKEGKDPDAKEEPKEAEGDKTDASGPINTIKQRWDSAKPADAQSVQEAAAKLAELMKSDPGLRGKLLKTFAGFKEQAATKSLGEALRAANVTRERLRGVLTGGRGPALKAIADPKYTEADGCTLQPQVDAACAPLFEVWRDPIGYAVKNMKLDLAAPAAKLDGLAQLLGGLVSELATWEGGAANAEATLRAQGTTMMDIKREETAANKDTLAANDSLKDKNVTDLSKDHVRALNDYRMMLGKAALRIDIALTKAAMGHAKYSESIKEIGHVMPGHPDGATHQERCKKAGYGGSTGENCLMGAEAGEDAVWQWYRAAEHHRSMIGDWIHIGAGHSGKYWVQNFGGGAGKGR